MFVKVRLNELMRPQMLEQHREHVIAFLEQEGIAFDPDRIGETEMSERQVKELMEELAHDLQ